MVKYILNGFMTKILRFQVLILPRIPQNGAKKKSLSPKLSRKQAKGHLTSKKIKKNIKGKNNINSTEKVLAHFYQQSEKFDTKLKTMKETKHSTNTASRSFLKEIDLDQVCKQGCLLPLINFGLI